VDVIDECGFAQLSSRPRVNARAFTILKSAGIDILSFRHRAEMV
jgi:hypothetical protein